MKYSIVTGGNRGIGKEICHKLLIQGYTVIAVYYDDDESALSAKKEFETEFPGKFFIIECDLSEIENISNLFLEVNQITQSIDLLILNAGKTIRRGIEDMTIAEWNSVMTVNLTAPVFLIQKFLPVLSRGSNIVFTGSSMAVYPHSLSLVYGISKSAVHALIKNLVKFLAPYDIRVNGVAPGFVDTDWHKDKPAHIKENITKKISLKRFAKPEEIASAFLFIIHNQYINGEIIAIDGGYSYE
jgi:3-oxoacyl-[acyl-carrier protein] reductase